MGIFRNMSSRQKFFLILTILWMVVIFSFSARPGSVSEQDSGRVGLLIGEIFVPGFEDWSEAEQQAFAETVDHPVRKTAHASEYALLGILAAGACIENGRDLRRRRTEIFIPWLTATVYAATDEFHQLFIPGRSGQVSDVLLDSAGALAGVLILAGVRYVWMSKKRKESVTEKKKGQEA